MSPELEIWQLISDMLQPLLFISLIEIAASVMLGLCVYNDARARQNDNAVLWAVLSGFFNLVALIYIIVQAASKSKPIFCLHCGGYVPEGYTVCPACSWPVAGRTMMSPEQVAAYKKRRTIFLVLFLVLYVFAIVLSVLLVFHFFEEVMEFAYTYSVY